MNYGAQQTLFVILAITIVMLLGALVYLLYRRFHGQYLAKKFTENIRRLPIEKKNITMNDIFEQVYYIALPERLTNIKNVLDSYNIRGTRIEPVLKDRLRAESFVQDGLIQSRYGRANRGRVACHLSHLKALETFLDTEAETALILEDDLKVCKNFELYQRRINSLAQEIPLLEWDVLYLGHCWARCKQFEKITQQIYKNGSPTCRHAYAVSRYAAGTILKNTLPMYNNGDEMIRKMGQDCILKIFTVMPPIFFQNRETWGSNLKNIYPLKICGDVEFEE
jgi:GR25 family glycosyltransferase involved in LPS biosynthesis